jgi:hypothetical protein
MADNMTLHEALAAQLSTLPVVTYANGYPTQALPKATLLDLLALHPAEPVTTIEVHHFDLEDTARHSNEGYAAAVQQFAEMLADTRTDLDAGTTAADVVDSLISTVEAIAAYQMAVPVMSDEAIEAHARTAYERDKAAGSIPGSAPPWGAHSGQWADVQSTYLVDAQLYLTAALPYLTPYLRGPGLGAGPRAVSDTGSLERAKQVAHDPAEYFARGRAEVHAEVRALAAPATPPGDGLHQKYYVSHLNDAAGKHDRCWYFVLDPAHDLHARAALLAYSVEAVKAGDVGLAYDIRVKLRELGDETDGSGQ